MKRSKLIELLAALDTPGVDDPEVCFVHPEGFGNQRINTVKIGQSWREGVEVPCISLDFDANLEEEAKPRRLSQVEMDQASVERLTRQDEMTYKYNVRALTSMAERIVQPYINSIVESHDLAKMNSELETEFRNAQTVRKVFLIKEGLRVIGANASTQGSALSMRWVSEFYPAARCGSFPTETHIPLGFFEKADLYLGLQAPLPPTLIAQHSSDPGDYTSLNPSYNPDTDEWPEVFIEAYNRAMMLGYVFTFQG